MAKGVMKMFDWRKHLLEHLDQYSWDEMWKPQDNSDETTKIEHYIYLGSCCSKIPPESDAILNVALELDNRTDINEYHRVLPYKVSLPDPGNLCEESLFREAVMQLYSLVYECQSVVFVHCVSGMNRSVSVVATCCALLNNTKVIDEVKKIAKVRPQIWPDACYIIMGQNMNLELR